ncbi:MAG: glucosaminidase domain-containing protein, partial [Erysipelotrichaceae bacterium]|nr:glucosaminidase domain-containing protein [Erysipelotrichaceae bacterium]
GFADLEYTDLVPSKFLEKGIPIWLGGRNVYENEDPFKVVTHQNYYQIEKNGKYYDLVFHFYRAYPTGNVNGNSALSSSIAVDNAKNYLDAGMTADTKYYSNDGIRFYSDPSLKNAVATVYNYYQFLSVRSTTDISASSFDSFLYSVKGNNTVMKGSGSVFIKGQNKYGCNALIIYAMACLESAYGTSGYAMNRNNLFGWSAYDDSPNDASYFSSVQNCVYEHMGRNLNWFMDYTNRRYFGTCVGNKGSGFNVLYASDPYWGAKIAAIAYSIDKYANNNDGNLTDHNSVKTGFVKNNYNDVLYSSSIPWDPKIYKSPTGNDVLYTGRFGTHYQKDLTVTVLEKVGTRYKIRSANPVVNGEINTQDGILEYDWNASVGYIEENDLVLLNALQTDIPDTRPEPTYEVLNSLRNVELSSDHIEISGVGAIQGMDFQEGDQTIRHTITFRSLEDRETAYSFVAENTDSDGFDLNDMYDYSFSGYHISIPLPNEDLPTGSYYVELTTENKDHSVTSYLLSPDKNLRNLNSANEEQNYAVRMNDYYNYRFEMDVLSVPDDLDFASTNVPSARPASVSLDSVALDEQGNAEIIGHAYMYYLNYNDAGKVGYSLYLVNSSENCLPLDTQLYDDGIDYKSLLGSNYDLTYICFRATGNISDLEGEYTVYLKMSNSTEEGNYLQIVEIPNYGLDLPSMQNETKQYSFATSAVRKRLMFQASLIEE